ncbi:CPBP family glutamic-type intramembrane protease [Blastococcus sp. BMG 814]|uniref:CPBP family glutamic-type intramembrane protease n=1 Tax=Blastococcus carthaginiensis TaxID=3050034 RepID=A0ABT9IC94_9ACTN|nr:CPBP family intramembrane glutamic endopeptidase [Blastococcus carthaginiensis]MDP5183191.1 CPBP family glutamic-type intramembrane protease [Blastococcus carthaginiensis]
MSHPAAGGGPAEEPYAGPPPTLRPAPGGFPVPPWPQAPGPYAPAPWHYAPAPFPPGPYAPAPIPPAPPAGWALPPGTPPHDEPTSFLHAMRARDWAWWRPLLGLLLLGVVFLVAGALLGVLGILTGISPDLALIELTDPGTLLVTNATLVVGIPVVWLAWAVAHGMRPGWSSSVLARFRWRLLPRLTVLALLSIGVVIGLSVLVGVTAGEVEVTGPIRSWGWLLAVVLLTTPLQSAAEEYLFRGYLSQAIAGWIRAPRAGAVVAAVVTGALFSLAHLPPDLATFLDRFLFALAASWVVWLTGGIEAAVVMHAVNNVVLFLLVALLGDAVATNVVPAGLVPVSLALTAAGFGGFVLLVARWRRRARPELRTPALDLRVPPGAAPVPAR